MQFTVDGKTFGAAVAMAAKLANQKTTIPILSGIRITADDGYVRIEATDLECAVRILVDAEVFTSGDAVYAGKPMLAAVKGAKGTLTFTDGTIGGMTVPTVGSVECWPDIPRQDDGADYAMIEGFGAAIKAVAFAISPEESRFTLNGARLTSADLCATDGHRLHLAKLATIGNVRETLMPRFALGLMRDWDRTTVFRRTDDYLFFERGSTTLIVRPLKGSFPDVQRVMPDTDGKWCLSVDRKPLLEAMKRAVQFAVPTGRDKKTLTVKLRLNGTCHLDAGSADTGLFSADVAARWTGPEDYEVGVNGPYLIDWLASESADAVSILTVATKGTNGALEPHVLDCYGANQGRSLIMPMRM